MKGMHTHGKAYKPCAACGVKGLNWAHDKAHPTEPCNKCAGQPNGRLVLLNPDGSLHDCSEDVEAPGGNDPWTGENAEESTPTPNTLSKALKLMQGTGEPQPGQQGDAAEAELPGDPDGPGQIPEPQEGEDDDCHACCPTFRETINSHTETTEEHKEVLNYHAGSINGHTAAISNLTDGQLKLSQQAAQQGRTLSKFVAKVEIHDAQIGELREAFKNVTESGTANMVSSGPVKVQVELNGKGVRDITGSAHKILPVVVSTLAVNEPVLLTGPAGTGKSHITLQAAEALELEHYELALSPQTMASSVIGYMQAEGSYVSTLFRKAYEHGGVFHFDEFDNAHPAVLAIINNGVAANRMAFPDGMVDKHPDFRCVASANTYGKGPDRTYTGRQSGDAATWDRFAIIYVGYDHALEMALCQRFSKNDELIREVLRFVRQVRKNAIDHRLPIVISPRASMGMVKMIEAGVDLETVVDARVRRGLSDQDWSKISKSVVVPELVEADEVDQPTIMTYDEAVGVPS